MSRLPRFPALSAERRRWRGTARNPGSDLARLPVGLDFAGISIGEGLRAAAASAAILILNAFVQSPALMLAAFAANFACFCDTGGPVRRRVPALLTFTVLGAMAWSAFGLMRAVSPWLVLPAAGLVVFCNSMARVWGLRAQGVGNVLTVVVALAVDKPLDLGEAGALFLAFIGGGAWATVLTVAIWRIHPERPALRALGANWRLLAAFCRDVASLVARPGAEASHWDAHARAHRRALRDAIEDARATLIDVMRPGPMSVESARNMLLLEAQDGIFGALIAMSDIAESLPAARSRASAGRLLRRLRPIFTLLERAMSDAREPARLGAGVRHDFEAAFLRMTADAEREPALGPVAAALIDRLRIASRLTSEKGALGGPAPPTWSGRLPDPALWLETLRANLTWRSAVTRHATRAAVLVFAAIAVAFAWPSPYAHWLTITVGLTVQPYFAATWQRALERIAGTALGASIGGTITFLPHSPFAFALMLVPLSVIGFSVRQVSYGAFIACLTPLTVLLFEVAEPGHAEWVVAGMRTAYTIGGGLVAVLACMVLWPSWEPERTEGELRGTLLAHARYAETVFAALAAETPWSEAEDARRRAGLASNNLEASLSRALQEPRARHARRIEALLAADAATRRLGGGLLALQLERPGSGALAGSAWAAWRAWLPDAMRRLADGGPPPQPRPPSVPPESPLARLGRAVDLIAGIVADLRLGPRP